MQKTENPQKNQAQHVDPEIERQLWEHGKLDDDELFMLIYTLQLMCGKYLGIRGGDELRSVRRSCLAFGFDQKTGITTLTVTYIEDLSRCIHGGLSKTNSPTVTQHQEDASKRFSFTALFKKSTEKLPENANLSDAMWFRPRSDIGKGGNEN